MLSAIFKGNSVIFGATATSIILGMSAGGAMMYTFQNEPTDIEYWNNVWTAFRSQYPLKVLPHWQRPHTILDKDSLKWLTPKLAKLSSPAQVKSIRVFVPLCGATSDLEEINDSISEYIESETESEEQAQQYRLKIIGVDASEDAIELFLDNMDMKEKEIGIDEVVYDKEYNFANNKGLYEIDEDIFSKIQIYKHNNYSLINCDIFDASIPRLILRADAVYDNQSLSYIHPKRRKGYLYAIENVVNRKAKIVLVTERFNIEDRDEKQQLKAPYSINGEDEVFGLFRKMVNMEQKNIKLLKSIRWIDEGEYGKERLRELGFSEGYTEAYSDVWLIQCEK